MKFFKIFVICLFVLFSGTFVLPASAQDTDARALYERATDEQIAEAQKFYRRCVQNDLMSKRQDCKCAATEYISKRLEMGDDALPSEIMAANVNSCLKQEVFSQNVDGVTDFSDVSDSDLKEAQQAHKQCSTDSYYYRNFDCECIAAKYLDMRIQEGPMLDYSTILTRVRNSCPNVVGSVGQQYQGCMNPNSYIELFDIVPQKEYCECYAREWGRIFKARGRPAGINTKAAINYAAYSKCNDVSMYNR